MDVAVYGGTPLENKELFLELKEEHVFVQIGEGDRSHQCWVMDMVPTNHMTGAQFAFNNLDIGVCWTIKFGDGSVVLIYGRGTIQFIRKKGEHRHLDRVYFIPRLMVNIISLG
jgi:hypothetical protein